ncbi:SusC/RagA family TonB-linked outer membrane protein [Gemmatimonadota bacterium]
MRNLKCVKLTFGVVLAVLLWATSASAQQGIITGVVQDEAGTGMANVQVSLLETEIGTLSSQTGAFRLEVAPGTYQLRVQSIGHNTITRTVTVAAGEVLSLSFRLSIRAINLEELIVSVDATQASRVEIGTDFETFNAALEADKAAITDLSSLLNARAPSLTINQSSGSTGSASSLRIRGSSSITQDNNPIVYVDGVRVSNATGTGPGSFDFGNGQTISRLNDINPQDIANVQVLKGPTAAALYGSEAAAGVILIETKKGESGEFRYTFSTEQGFNRDVATYWDNYYNLTTNAGVTDVNDPRFQQWRPILNPATGEVFARHNPMNDPWTNPRREGYVQRYSLEARGGTDAVTYFSSVRWESEDGTLPNNELDRLSLRANLVARPSEKLDFSVSSSFVDSYVRLPDNDRSAVGMITNAGAGLPLFSFGRDGGCLATLVSGLDSSNCARREGNLTANYGKLATIQNTQDAGRFLGSITANWRPLGWLSARGTVGLDYVQTANKNLVPLDSDRPFGSNSDGLVDELRSTEQVLTAEFTATASHNFADRIASTSSAGVQYFGTDRELIGCGGEGGFASPTAVACNAALTFTGSSDKLQTREAGAFFQQRLGLDEYLFVTGGLRVDDNSSFGENQDAIVSPSANISLALSRMAFWGESSVSDFVSDLRLRLAWGKAAQAPAPFAQSRTFRPVRLEEGGTQIIGISPLDPGNPDLAPERNEELEIGLDAGLLDNRVSFKFTYFDQKTTDAIVPTDVAPSTGFTGTKFVNLGEVKNKGWEASIGGMVLERSNVTWDANLTFSTNDPVVTSLGGEETILFGLGADHQMFREGFAPGAYYGRVVGSAERAPDGSIVPGSIVFMEGNVGPGGRPDAANPNHRYLGNPEPTNQQSFFTTITLFNNLRIYTLFDRSGGFSKFDDSNAFRTPFIPNTSGSRRYAMRQAESSPAEQAAMELGGDVRTSLFIQDADYIKWRELTVSYQVPESLVRYLGAFDALSISAGGRNLATWTDYEGLDPELRFDGGRDSFNAAEFFTQPPVRYFFVRFNFSF